jgi:adenylate cyclase
MGLRRAAIALSIAAGASLAAIALSTVQFFDALFGQLEYVTQDWRVRSAVTRSPDSTDVVLVLFDSATVSGWPYLMPFPRAALAEMVDVVSRNGARAIGLDVYLDQRYPLLEDIDQGDSRLRAAIERAGNVVLVAPTAGTSTARRLLPPDPYFAEVAAAVASADLPTPYETIREAVLTVRTDRGLVPGFSLALYALAQGQSVDSLLAAAGRAGRLDVPAMPRQYAELPARAATQVMPIRFQGPASRTDLDRVTFPALTGLAIHSLSAEGMDFVLAPYFQDKIVLLGSGFHDSERFRTPYYMEEIAGTDEIYGWTYGVEIHANALENLLRGDYLKPLGTAWELLLCLLVAAAAAGATFWRGAKWGAVLGAGVVGATFVGAWYLFGRDSLAVPMISPALAGVLAFLGSTSYVSIVEGKEKRIIRSAFAKYVAPAVVDQLVSDPSRLKLGGDRRTVSILFSDLAGFTSMTESMSDRPEVLLGFLNEYLDEMADIVLDEAGTLDKYIGDAIMAFWNAPNTVEDHGLRACRTALRMQRRLEELNEAWLGRGLPALAMRIGVNTGTPIIGNIGGQKRFDYTALGDAVNLAARLEPACKNYGVSTLISDRTLAETGGAVQVRELDILAVYGKREGVRIYELLALPGEELGDEKRAVLDLYEKGFDAYRRRDFELASEYFQAVLELDPEDGPSAVYLDRCRAYIVEPPPADWDFVERRRVKG